MSSLNNNFYSCPFNDSFIIIKSPHLFRYELCLKDKKDEEGYPEIIGKIYPGKEGNLKNVTNLAWFMKYEYRGFGYMNQLLDIYLNEIEPEGCFAVIISKDNDKSLNLALKNKFVIYDEDDCDYYLKR